MKKQERVALVAKLMEKAQDEFDDLKRAADNYDYTVNEAIGEMEEAAREYNRAIGKIEDELIEAGFDAPDLPGATEYLDSHTDYPVEDVDGVVDMISDLEIPEDDNRYIVALQVLLAERTAKARAGDSLEMARYDLVNEGITLAIRTLEELPEEEEAE